MQQQPRDGGEVGERKSFRLPIRVPALLVGQLGGDIWIARGDEAVRWTALQRSECGYINAEFTADGHVIASRFDGDRFRIERLIAPGKREELLSFRINNHERAGDVVAAYEPTAAVTRDGLLLVTKQRVGADNCAEDACARAKSVWLAELRPWDALDEPGLRMRAPLALAPRDAPVSGTVAVWLSNSAGGTDPVIVSVFKTDETPSSGRYFRIDTRTRQIQRLEADARLDHGMIPSPSGDKGVLVNIECSGGAWTCPELKVPHQTYIVIRDDDGKQSVFFKDRTIRYVPGAWTDHVVAASVTRDPEHLAADSEHAAILTRSQAHDLPQFAAKLGMFFDWER